MRVPTLLPILQAMIEASYRMPRVIDDAGRFLIGDSGLKMFYVQSGSAPIEYGADARGAGARLLVRTDPGPIRAAVYFPDAMVKHLEQFDPRAGLGDRNIDAFATLVEELDHLLTLASRAVRGRPVSLLELEIHAGVTKYLMVLHFIGRLTSRPRVSGFHKCWARHHLFEKYAAGSDEEAERYREAARMAARFVAWLDRLKTTERRAALTSFHARALGEQIRFIENLG
jgi:hypothetical protein